MLVGTAQTWAFIKSQLDRPKIYRVHVIDDDYKPICGTNIEADEVTDMTALEFEKYGYACKRCVRCVQERRRKWHVQSRKRLTQ